MTPQDWLKTIANLFEAGAVRIYIPLFIWLMLFGMFLLVLRQAHAKGSLDASELLRNDTGKLSWGRAGGGLCLVTHTWSIVVSQIGGTLTLAEMALYALTWSGSLVLLDYLKTIKK